MKKQIFSVTICFLLILTIIPIADSLKISSDNNFLTINNTKTDKGWIEEKKGIKIVHLKGSFYEMGYQHGSLLKEEILQNLRAYFYFSEKLGYEYEDLIELWNKTKAYIPEEYINELQGLADALDISLSKAAAGNIANMFAHCSSMAAWDTATVDGELYYMRSLDYPMNIQDNVSGKFLQENSVLIIRKPNNSYGSIDPTFAGLAGSLGGFNEKAIATCVLSCWSNDETSSGIPMVFRQRMILDYAENYTQALKIISNNKTMGWNHIISDGRKPIGYAVETTAKTDYIGTWNTPTESKRPFWQIENVVRRTNIFIDAETASKQRDTFNPKKFPILNMILGKNNLGWSSVSAFIPWIHYKVLSNAIEKQWGKLDLNTTMKLTRDVYLGKTDFLFYLLQRSDSYTSLNQWVACPKTGDMLLSFADRENNAFEKQFHYFNIFKLLEN